MVFAPPISLQTAAKVAEGNWPKLKRLCFEGNIPSVGVLQQIAQGRWPLLTYLEFPWHKELRSKYLT